MGSGLWGIAVIVGPILFIAVAIWVVMNNRRTPREEARTERATRQLREDIHDEEAAREHKNAAD